MGCRLRQKHFLKEAARQATPKAVRQALRFVHILPRAYAQLQTYNMVVTVCIRAKDMASALQAADMLRSTGRKPDAFLYTNLISGVWPCRCPPGRRGGHAAVLRHQLTCKL